MSRKIESTFVGLAALIFSLLAVAHLATAANTAPVLGEIDPVVHLSGRHVLLVTGAIELLLSALLLMSRGKLIPLGLSVFFTTALLLHRELLHLKKAANFTDCLGNIDTWFPVSPRLFSTIMWGILGCLFVGSYAALILSRSNAHAPEQTDDATKSDSTPCPGKGSRIGRLLLGWGLGAVCVALIVGGLNLRTNAKLPGHFREMINEIGAIGTFRDLPVGNPSGTKVLYAREMEHGVGFFLKDLASLKQRQIGSMDDPLSTPDNAFRMLGWSPDERHLAIAVDTKNNQTIAVCSGETGALEKAFSMRDPQRETIMNVNQHQEVKRAAWLGNDKIALMDGVHTLYLAELTNNHLRELLNYTTFNKDPAYTLVATSDHTFAFADTGIIWELNTTNGGVHKLLTLTNAAIEWLDYEPTTRQFLFCRSDPTDKNPEKIHVLCRFDPHTEPKLVELTHEDTLKGQWLLGGRAIAYVTGPGKLVIQSSDPALATNLFIGGYARNYTVSPARDRLYANAKLGSEPMGLWEYDVAQRKLRAVVPGLDHELAYSQIATRVDKFTSEGHIPYSVVAPTPLNPGKRYPVIIDQPSESQFTQDAQFLANSGIYYVTVMRDGLDNLLAIYKQVLDIPYADPHRIYILGSSFRTETLSQAFERNASMWRGVMFMSPLDFPNIPENSTSFPSVLISIGTRDMPAGLEKTEKFTYQACRHLIPTRVIYHQDAPHIFNNTTMAKERFDAMTKFILEDF